MPAPSFAGAYIAQPIIKAKVAAYTVLNTESGVFFTTRGATVAVTFTLPAVTDLPAGFDVSFYGVSAFGFTVASNGSLDNIIALNDVAADSITCTTTSLMIGTYVRVIWDGVKWLSIRGDGGTYTVA